MGLPVIFPCFGAKYRQDRALPAVLSVFSPVLLREIPTRWNFSGRVAGIFQLERLPMHPVWAQDTGKIERCRLFCRYSLLCSSAKYRQDGVFPAILPVFSGSGGHCGALLWQYSEIYRTSKKSRVLVPQKVLVVRISFACVSRK